MKRRTTASLICKRTPRQNDIGDCTMKKRLMIINAIAMVAFYLGAAFFLTEGNRPAGILAALAGTCSLIAMILNGRDSRSK